MCIAVMGRVCELGNNQAKVEVEENRIMVNTQLTPNVEVGQFVLVHAGFSINVLKEKEVLATKTLLDEISHANDSHAEL